MRATGPAARAAHSAFKLGECLFDTDIPRLRFFAGDDPANPFVARERRDVVPYRFRRRCLNQGLLPIIRHCMYRPTGDLVFAHMTILSNPQYWGWYDVRLFENYSTTEALNLSATLFQIKRI